MTHEEPLSPEDHAEMQRRFLSVIMQDVIGRSWSVPFQQAGDDE